MKARASQLAAAEQALYEARQALADAHAAQGRADAAHRRTEAELAAAQEQLTALQDTASAQQRLRQKAEEEVQLLQQTLEEIATSRELQERELVRLRRLQQQARRGPDEQSAQEAARRWEREAADLAAQLVAQERLRQELADARQQLAQLRQQDAGLPLVQEAEGAVEGGRLREESLRPPPSAAPRLGTSSESAPTPLTTALRAEEREWTLVKQRAQTLAMEVELLRLTLTRLMSGR
jgi:DNA repair exonuclease SbcCD ATPase subunit